MDQNYEKFIGTLNYKAPEICVMNGYDYAVDIWSLGKVMARMVFKNMMELEGSSNFESLKAMIRIVGTEKLREFHGKYQFDIKNDIHVFIYHESLYLPGKGFDSLVNKDNYETATDEAIDLLCKMLTIDHEQRITAKDAMEHPYFDSLKN